MTKRSIVAGILCLSLFLLVGCPGTAPPVKPTVDKQVSYFNPKHHNPISIFPTYKYVGEQKSETDKVYRTYYVWNEEESGKYIVITVLNPKGKFPQGVQWVDKTNALYVQGNKAAYNYLNMRLASALTQMGMPLGECIIIAQEFYYNDQEVIYKSLIVPDKWCTENAKPVIEELNRVANMQ